MFTREHLQRLNEACVELYRPGLTLENFSERTFAFLSRLVPSELIAFGSLDRKTQHLSIGFNASVPQLQKTMEAFGRVMGNYDLYRWDPSVNGGRPFCRSDFYSNREFRSLDMFSEVYRVLGIDNHCAVHVPCGPKEIAFCGIERKGGPDFSAEERALLELAQVQLGHARELAVANSRTSDDQRASPQVLMRAGLTSREADVLTWLSEGKSNDEIAILLRLQLNTVKGYLKTIFQKIGAPNRLAAALWALRFCWSEQARMARESSRFAQVQANIPR